MADNKPVFGRPKPPMTRGGDSEKLDAGGLRISCRATNPLSLNDDLSKVFLDRNQARATTATRLFRNEDLFAAIRKIVIPAYLKVPRTKFSMWSSGCSSGEEVYSMAMVALGAFATAKRQVPVEAFGTDINRERIAEAVQGVYLRPGANAFSQAYWRLLERYAEVGERDVYMGETLRTACKFRLFDMRQRPKKHTFFFIVCNHVLQYYDNEGQKHIIENLKSVLNPGGLMYLEGLTDHSLDGSRLSKVEGTQNLFKVG